MLGFFGWCQMHNSVIVQWHYTTMIIAILNEKGGVGKTILATNLARAFQAEHRSVLLVDSDPQGSLRDWLARGRRDDRLPADDRDG